MTKLDPRFIRLKKQATKVVVDKRFESMFNEEGEFARPVSVDKYGRPIASKHHIKELERFYRLDTNEREEDERKEEHFQGDADQLETFSSTTMDSDDESSSLSDNEADYVMDEAISTHPLVARDVPTGDATRRLAIVNLDWDQIQAEDIFTLFNAFKPSTGTILSVTIYPSQFGQQRMAREQLEGPAREVFTEKGQEAGNDEDEDQETENLLDEEQVNELALRKYQLERLRYYYAVIECDSVATAQYIYQHCDGSEFEKSANFLDLRFIPDKVQFDGPEDAPPRDRCTTLPNQYKPKPELMTGALQSTRVTLTWDADDAERKRIIMGRQLRGEALEEADLKAYLASSSDEENDSGSDEENDDSSRDEENDDSGSDEENEDKEFMHSKVEGKEIKTQVTSHNHQNPISCKSSKQQKIERYRRLLLEKRENDEGSVFGKKGERGADLSITFASALQGLEEGSEKDDSDKDTDDQSLETSFIKKDLDNINNNADEDDIHMEATFELPQPDQNQAISKSDMTPFQKYMERRKIKKEARREMARQLQEQEELERKKTKGKKRKISPEERERIKIEQYKLTALLGPGDGESSDEEKGHKSKKTSNVKDKMRGKRRIDRTTSSISDDKVNVEDDRFRAIYEEPAYALDPTHPSFKRTPGIERIIRERQRRLYSL